MVASLFVFFNCGNMFALEKALGLQQMRLMIIESSKSYVAPVLSIISKKSFLMLDRGSSCLYFTRILF